MKKYLKYILGTVILLTFLLLINIKNKSLKKIENNNNTKETIKVVNKELYFYRINDENNDIEELLKENVKVTYKINYVCQENDSEEEVFNNEESVEDTLETSEKNGFEIVGDNTYYYENNNLTIGYKKIENNIYYFDEMGVMLKHDFIDKKYFDDDGKQVLGFFKINDYIYYFLEDGYITGLNEIDNNKYYFDDNGILQKGIINIKGTNYLFDDNGILKTGFKKENGKTYFYDENNNKLTGLQLIEGKRYYFDFNTGELIKKNVKSIVDISAWQGDIDFDKLKESDLIDGVIVRIGYGTSKSDKCVLDKKFKRNISELNRLNIPYGIYIYGYAQNEIAANIEADFILDTLKKYNVNLSFPVFYDAENTYYNGVFYSKDMYEKVITTFTSKLKKQNIEVGVYGNLYMLTKGSLNSNLIKNNPVWVAQYYDICQYEEEYIGWQYTSKGVVPGIEGNVDMNIFY